MSFSERMGFKAGREVMQLDDVDVPLRTAIYNHLHGIIVEAWFYGGGLSEGYEWGRLIWTEFMRRPVDQFSDKRYEFESSLRRFIETCPWYEVYDLVEFCVTLPDIELDTPRLNEVLERDMSAYRVRAGKVIPVTDAVELSVVDEALVLDGGFEAARQHVVAALEKLSQKPEPDLRNAITEAVSAVESAARIVTGKHKATLGDALKVLDKTKKVHPALKDAWLKLYGYTSDEHGLRHAMTEDPNIDFGTAKYMVISCAAFVNLLAYSS